MAFEQYKKEFGAKLQKIRKNAGYKSQEAFYADCIYPIIGDSYSTDNSKQNIVSKMETGRDWCPVLLPVYAKIGHTTVEALLSEGSDIDLDQEKEYTYSETAAAIYKLLCNGYLSFTAAGPQDRPALTINDEILSHIIENLNRYNDLYSSGALDWEDYHTLKKKLLEKFNGPLLYWGSDPGPDDADWYQRYREEGKDVYQAYKNSIHK